MARAKQINTKWNEPSIKELYELRDLLGLKQEHAGIPLTIRFAITYTLELLKRKDLVIPMMSERKLSVLLSLVKRSKLSDSKAGKDTEM